jgi:hypothetical protein
MYLINGPWHKKLSDGSALNVWKGENGWYWNRIGANGRGMQTGGEPFTRKWNAKRAALRSIREVKPI